MKRGLEYNWESTRELQEISMVCGFCGQNITTKDGYTGWIRTGAVSPRQNIYICHKCSHPNFFGINGKQYPTFKGIKATFSDEIKSVSPRFIEIYSQSQEAEDEGLDEIAGPGYGKALEFLVKDYLIKSIPEDEKIIKKLSLHDCIHDKLENPKIKALADKARVIRNDETHYERKYENSDILDLKKLINATAAWVDLEAYTSEVSATDSTKVSDRTEPNYTEAEKDASIKTLEDTA